MEEYSSTGTREYRYSKLTMLGAINDLIELQKGGVTYRNLAKGQLFFTIEMYGFIWENRYTVEHLSEEASRVILTIEGRAHNKEEKIIGQFALLDSILIGIDRADQ